MHTHTYSLHVQALPRYTVLGHARDVNAREFVLPQPMMNNIRTFSVDGMLSILETGLEPAISSLGGRRLIH